MAGDETQLLKRMTHLSITHVPTPHMSNVDALDTMKHGVPYCKAGCIIFLVVLACGSPRMPLHFLLFVMSMHNPSQCGLLPRSSQASCCWVSRNKVYKRLFLGVIEYWGMAASLPV
jgi:hypothetical protein